MLVKPFLGAIVAATGVLTLTASASAAATNFIREDSVLQHLHHIVTIGSTIDPTNGDLNPYGLDVARSTMFPIMAGDLVICNFNDSANVQGTGTTIVALHPQIGSTPLHIAADPSLLGCDAVALAPDDTIWAAAFAANDNPIFTLGKLDTTLPGGPWHGPFGEAFSPNAPRGAIAAFYESNAGDGSIVRISILPGPTFAFATIATGFAFNGGAPGSILGPSGLQYDAKHDRLYVVDGADNSVVALEKVSRILPGGVALHGSARFVSGPFAQSVRLVFQGAPLNGPISSALLADGHLVVGNTLDANGKNLMIELTPNGRVVDVVNVDTGAAGAIFGMVATGHDDFDTKLYFNDDNATALEALVR